MRKAVASFLLVLSACAAGGSHPRASPSPSTDWTPPEPSFGAPLFPGSEYLATPGRDPGEYTRRWVHVIGGRSYCITAAEEFGTGGAGYNEVIAWFQKKLKSKGYKDAVERSTTWEWKQSAHRTVTVKVTNQEFRTSTGTVHRVPTISYSSQDFLQSSEDCKSTMVIHR